MTKFATPGVYIREKSAFSSSVVAVPTAVPAFIGYTETASRGKTSLTNVPTRIASMADYVALFGGAPTTTYKLKIKDDLDYEVSVDNKTQFNLYRSLQLFYANGGGACYIVSVGDYSNGVNAKDLNNPEIKGGLQALLTEQEPTLVVIPDATLLSPADCYSLYQAVLNHCGGAMKSRFGIFDVHGGTASRTFDDKDIITAFREGVGNNFLDFGAGYYPWLMTTVVNSADITHENVSNTHELFKLLNNEAEINVIGQLLEAPSAPKTSTSKSKADDKDKDESSSSASASPKPPPGVDDRTIQKLEAVKEEIKKLKDKDGDPVVVHQNLLAISPLYKEVLAGIREDMNILPPSGAIAGLYAMVDNAVGVHKAPANISVSSTIAPAVNITKEDQEDLNVPINGKAVNAIRGFIGKGVLVWGGRTLDGNSQDWRYINVRRTMIMLEQSIKAAIEAYVFEPNTPATWIRVRMAIGNFLDRQWRSGALVGDTPDQAYQVLLGLGVTMTPIDVLDGIMRVTVRVAVSRPAEFIEITFEQKMQEGGGAAEA